MVNDWRLCVNGRLQAVRRSVFTTSRRRGTHGMRIGGGLLTLIIIILLLVWIF
jgi:hypothetical protein